MGGILPQGGPQKATPSPSSDGYSSMSDKERNLIEYHRKHLRDGTFLEDDKGVTTLYETGFMGKDGKIHSVPGFVGGKRLSEAEAKKYYEDRPNLLNKYPTYNTGKEANAAAKSRGPIKERDLRQFKATQKPKQ